MIYLLSEKINVKKAKLTDCDDMYSWRNDYSTRLMLHNSNKIEFNSHKKWYLNKLHDPSFLLLICCSVKDEKKVGYVSFHNKYNYSIVSIVLDSTMRKKNFSFECLVRSIEFFKNINPNIKKLKADIKNNNYASEKIFLKAGFIKEKEESNFKSYSLNLSKNG